MFHLQTAGFQEQDLNSWTRTPAKVFCLPGRACEKRWRTRPLMRLTARFPFLVILDLCHGFGIEGLTSSLRAKNKSGETFRLIFGLGEFGSPAFRVL